MQFLKCLGSAVCLAGCKSKEFNWTGRAVDLARIPSPDGHICSANIHMLCKLCIEIAFKYEVKLTAATVHISSG